MERKHNGPHHPVTLKTLAKHLGLTPGTVSKVLNNAKGAKAISEGTKARVRAAAHELEYRPNFHAQSLRTKRTYMIGVLVPEISDREHGLLMAGIERVLSQRGYLCLVGVHRQNAEMLAAYASLFSQRGAEGMIAVDTENSREWAIPTVSVTVPKDTPTQSNARFAPSWGASAWPSSQSHHFVERLGWKAAETMLARLEDCRENPLPFPGAGMTAQTAPSYSAAITS